MLTQGPHKVAHIYRRQILKAPGLGPQCKEALLPLGQEYVSSYQASVGGSGLSRGLGQPLGCLPQLLALPGNLENKGFPFSFHQRKGSRRTRAMWRMCPGQGSPKGQGIKWRQQKRAGDIVFRNI